MSRFARRHVVILAGAPLLAAFVACSSKPATQGAPGPAAPGPTAAPVASAAASASASASARRAAFKEDDFVESEKSRDPFRKFLRELKKQQDGSASRTQVNVMLREYSIEDLRLVALVTHTDTPRAMLLDPQGRGWVVTKGQFVGRPEIVHAGGQSGADYEMYWRVDRIRDADIVLMRDDPNHPEVAAATHVVALRPEGDTVPGSPL